MSVSVINWRTTDEDIKITIETIKKALQLGEWTTNEPYSRQSLPFHM